MKQYFTTLDRSVCLSVDGFTLVLYEFGECSCCSCRDVVSVGVSLVALIGTAVILTGTGGPTIGSHRDHFTAHPDNIRTHCGIH